MTFLEGAFLAGIFAVGIPVVIHLLHRRKAPPVQFPSLRFLREVHVRTARRSRITEWLVLLLRAAALFFLALALSRPVLTKAPLGRGRATRIFIVDNSMSARVHLEGMSALEQYRVITRKLLWRMEPADQGAIVPLYAPPGYVPALTESRTELERILGNVVPTYRASPLSDALRRAVRLLEGDDNPVEEIYLLTDLQASAFAESFERVELPRPARLLVLKPREPSTLNALVAGVEVRNADTGAPRVTARLRGFGVRSLVVRVALVVDGREIEERAVEARPQGEVRVEFEVPDLPGGVHRAQIRIRDDSLPADNSLHFAVATRDARGVLVVRDATPTTEPVDPGFYLTRALVPRREPQGPLRVQAASTEGLADLDLSPFDVIFLVEPRNLSAEAGKALTEFVLAGGGLFTSSGPAQDESVFRNLNSPNTALVPAQVGPIVRATGAPFHLRSWTKDHAIWAPLVGASPPLRPDIPIFLAYRRVRPLEGSRVVGTFDSGDIALVESPVGLGKSLLFTSTLSSAWNDLPLKFLYAPLVHSTLRYLSPDPWREEVHLAGAPLLLSYPPHVDVVEVQVESGDGTTLRPRSREEGRRKGKVTSRQLALSAPGASTGPEEEAPVDAGGGLTFDLGTPEEPDLLVVRESFRGRDRYRFVSVRPELRESDLRPLSREDLQALLPEAQVVEFSSEAEALRGAVQLTVGSELKTPLLFLLIVLLVVEPLLANRSALRQRATRGDGPSPGDVSTTDPRRGIP